MKALFEPFRIGRREVKNRLAKTATAETIGSFDGFVTETYVDWYKSFAKGGVGLIHTGIVYAAQEGRTMPHEVGLDCDDKIPGFWRLAKAVHEHDCLILAQLHHPGRNLLPVPGYSDISQVVAPSPVKHLMSRITPRELTIPEIESVVQSWGDAARRAEEAGLDGVQIHVAHGYLIHSFVAKRTNRRNDIYGGELDSRLKVVQDIVNAVRSQTGNNFLVTLKLSGNDGPLPGGITARLAAEIAEKIGKMDVDAIEVSSGTYEYPSTTRGSFPLSLAVKEGSAIHLPGYIKFGARFLGPLLSLMFRYKEGFNMEAIRMIREKTSKPLICLGGFKTPEVMAGILEAGEGDIISLGRQLIADPEFPNKIRSGEEITECTFCNKCIMLAGTKPALCYEEVDYRESFPPDDEGIKE